MHGEMWMLGPVLLATLAPGPSMLLALDQGLRFGAARTLPTALGNTAATALQAALSWAGLQVAVAGSPQILVGVRYVGALYLIWLGLCMGRGERRAQEVEGSTQVLATSRTQRFRQAFFVTLWNPSAYLFFTALMPPFLATPSGRIRLAFGLLLPTLGITFSCMMLYARFGQSLVRYLEAPFRARVFRLLMGGSFVGLGLWMAVSR